ncbi:50S ribosome-binding protein YggL [Pseudaeromonas paramecii]|uniref:YggL family protein n=1 Tax=Pseudaeromonas paramecii TaxID=2138166 RepID=A0ABP8QHV6_9GAMM
MAQRSRRLRKKLRVDEFQELGFELNWHFAAGTEPRQVDAVIDRFIADLIEPRGLAFAGSGYLAWEGLVCTQAIGRCSEEDRQAVEQWLSANGGQAIEVSPLFDVWYGDPA